MEHLAQYETQATEVEVDSQSVAPTEIQSDEDPTQVITRSVSRSTSPITPTIRVRVPDVAVEQPPLRRGHRLVPDGRGPKSTRGWTYGEVAAAIERAGLTGSWRQGGQDSRIIWEGDQYIINVQPKGNAGISMTVWVQGRRANEIDARLRAARLNAGSQPRSGQH